MAIFVTRRAPRSAPLSSNVVRRIARAMLDYLDLPEAELSILLISDEAMREINREHRGKDKPTDVLSFPQVEFRAAEIPRKGHDLSLLGDVVISIDTAGRQARARKRPLVNEVRFLLAHGILHLLGHDHMTRDEKIVMTRRTKELVNSAPLMER